MSAPSARSPFPPCAWATWCCRRPWSNPSPSAARLLELLARLTARHEAGRPKPWSLNDAPTEYIERQLRAIVGFALPIRRLEGQWKLSQNRQDADRAGVREGLAVSDNPRDRELAARMEP